MWIAFIIGVMLNLILACILRQTTHYNHGDPQPFKLRGITWISWLVCTLIPILNIILGSVVLILMIIGLVNDDLWFEYDEDHWLFKKY